MAVLAPAGLAGAGTASGEGAELAAGLDELPAGPAEDVPGPADDAAGLAVVVAEAEAAMVSGLGLAVAAGAATRVSRIAVVPVAGPVLPAAVVTAVVPVAGPVLLAAVVTAVVPVAGPVLPAAVPDGAAAEGLLATGSAQGITAGADVVGCAPGKTKLKTLTAAAEAPANTLAAGGPAARMLTPPASRREACQRHPRWRCPAAGRPLR